MSSPTSCSIHSHPGLCAAAQHPFDAVALPESQPEYHQVLMGSTAVVTELDPASTAYFVDVYQAIVQQVWGRIP